ncbi:MAG TPA: T9SS type A sorting domain-containing protein [Puia sp.]|nr:T9SS type A sorting domain-containing protein [Puia sp.]
MQPFKWAYRCIGIGLTLLFILSTQPSFCQHCASAPIAAAACSGGNGAATAGLSIGSGKTYWVNSGSVFSTLTLNGGTLRVCSSLIISTLNFTSGNLVVESGGSVIISGLSSTNLNGNVVFVNRGTIIIAANMNFQNPGNAIYNDLSTSVFTVSGLVTVNSATIVNRGTMTLSSLYDQGAAGNFCVEPQSITNVGAFTNVTTNSFSYMGAGSPACLNVTGTTVLNSNVTSSNKIHVCKKSGVTPTGGATGNPGGGWGSAVVTSNCGSCATVLSLNIGGFTATQQGDAILLQWTVSHDLSGDEVFYVEKSVDGANFYDLTVLGARAGQYSYSVTDPAVTATKVYYRVRAVSPSGADFYSTVALVETGVSGQFQIYPNPARPNTQITLVIPSTVTGTASISMVDMAGKPIRTRTVNLQNGNNTLTWDLQGVAAGIYVLRVEGNSNAGLYLYGRVSVQARN